MAERDREIGGERVRRKKRDEEGERVRRKKRDEEGEREGRGERVTRKREMRRERERG